MSDRLIKPHGGTLVNLLVDEKEGEALKKESRDMPSWDLTDLQVCDLELLINGAFSPLTGFMGSEEAMSVAREMRLLSGLIWPLPVILDVPQKFAQSLTVGDRVALRDPEGVMLAVITLTEIWEIPREELASHVYGTVNKEHVGVKKFLEDTHSHALAGHVQGLQLPLHYDFVQFRQTPRELRNLFARRGWRKVVAFQTRNPMHRAHFELTLRASKDLQANVLIHPAVGKTKPGDVDHYTRVRCYQALMGRYPRYTAHLSLLPLAMRMAGPKEALFHALIRKNYGCTHFIVGRDHAGPGNDLNGNAFYEPYEAQNLFKTHEEELGISMVPFKNMVYVPDMDRYKPKDEVPPGKEIKSISGTEFRARLEEGRKIPQWFSFPEVIEELRKTYPPRYKQGFTVFFTGLSGAGKSTVARVLLEKLLEIGGRPVTLLDGDIVRKNLSSELGFSKEHRNLNIMRIGFVASEITKNGGIAICAPIAPYEEVREKVRQLISARGGFILIHVATPLQVCEQRDRKGLYAKARAGIITQFTGISDPYEEPQNPDVIIDTAELTQEEAAQKILLYLEKQGYWSGKKNGF